MATLLQKLVDGTIEILQAISSSSGVADAGKPIVLNAQGEIDNSMFPASIGTPFDIVQATENLVAGDFCNVYEVTPGVDRVRKADATDQAKVANGFVLEAVTSGNNATVFSYGLNSALTVVSGSEYYLSSTTPGAATTTAPSETSGHFQQTLGHGRPSGLVFEFEKPINFP